MRFMRRLSLEMATLVIYGTSSGNTEKVARFLRSKSEEITKIVNIEEFYSSGMSLDGYDGLIIGTPTLNTGYDQYRSGTRIDEWIYEEVPNLGLRDSHLKIALYGLGNARGYAFYFCDAVGEVYDILCEVGATVCGTKVPIDDYDFEESKAIRDGKFVGCMFDLDSEEEEERSEGRADRWIVQLQEEGFPI